MENPKEQLVSRIKEANNVLVTVSANPSVDQLSAAIGLTLFLTKLKKHSTAVFSGEVPSTIEFLKPEETIEGNTDSLQDFIIALDKNKADKIRYKVEDQMVKIFITPYRTSIGGDDLVFSKGDFNVDVVIALGVHKKEDLDQAITAHGRILHDATVATINTKESSELGSLNWTDQQASSLCEMVVVMADQLKVNSFDAQMATALLTGIVAETERFSNVKTTSNTMNASAKLMAAGANQQLVATKLEEAPPEITPPTEPQAPGGEAPDPGGTVVEDGSLVIHHEEKPKEKPAKPEAKPAPKPPELPPPKPKPEPKPEPEPEKPKELKEEEVPYQPPEPPEPPPQVRISEEGELQSLKPPEPPIHIKPEHREFLAAPPSSQHHDDTIVGGPAGQSLLSEQPSGSHFITEPPSMGGKLSAAADDFDSDTNPLTLPSVEPPILSHDSDKNKTKSQEKQADEPPDIPPPLPPPPPPPPPPAPPEPPRVAHATKSPAPSPAPEPKPSVTTPVVEKKSAVEAPTKPKERISKLPESFIKVLDDRTIKELEHRTHSPHETQPADQMKGKTLQGIEEVVDSPHQLKAKLDKKPSEVKEPVSPFFKGPTLEYEAHESEPPAKDGTEKQEIEKHEHPPLHEEAGKSVFSTPPSPLRDPAKHSVPQPTEEAEKIEKQPAKPSDEPANADAARNAVLQAINTGGDGRTALPRMEGIGSTDVGLNLSHAAPPAASSAPVQSPQQPSPHIHIDDEGTVTFRNEPVVDEITPKPLRTSPLSIDPTASAESKPTSPPPGPPPMMPPHLTANPGVSH